MSRISKGIRKIFKNNETNYYSDSSSELTKSSDTASEYTKSTTTSNFVGTSKILKAHLQADAVAGPSGAFSYGFQSPPRM